LSQFCGLREAGPGFVEGSGFRFAEKKIEMEFIVEVLEEKSKSEMHITRKRRRKQGR